MSKPQYGDLYFSSKQLFLSPEETVKVAEGLMARSPPASQITDKDRAYVQRALLIAVDKSEKASFLFNILKSASEGAVSKDLTGVVEDLAKSVARRWFSNYIDETPMINPAGVSSIRQSHITRDWQTRVRTEDLSYIENYLIPG